jgi:glycosyltransferase involved in cell wall biosynthesis
MRLSVVIPVFNRQHLAERALRSALAQGLDDMQVVVVDDCSTPPFELPPDIDRTRLRVVRHSTNRGAGAARDSGVAASAGQWIAFLDSDDYWLPGTLPRRLDAAESHYAASGNPMVAHAAGFVLDRKPLRRNEARIPRCSADLKDFASACWFAHGSTMLVRREVFALVGPSDPELRRLEDFDWLLRFALKGGRLEVWPEMAAVVEIRGKPRIEAVEAAIARLDQKYVAPTGDFPLPAPLVNRLEAYFDIERASAFAADRKWLPMIAYLGRSFWRVPRTTLHLGHFWRTAGLPAGLPSG